MSEDKKYSIKDEFANFMASNGEDTDGLVGALNKYRDLWLAERRNRHDRMWRESIAFYSGNQNIRDMGTSSNAYRVRVRENHTNNVITRMLSIFAQNMPVTRVFPNSSDREDAMNAENTELYSKYFWRTQKLEQRFTKFIKYSLIMGNAFMIDNFDPDAGGKILLSSSETESGDEEIKEYRGECRVEVADPLKILIRPGIEEMDDMYDYIYSVPVSKAMLEGQYGCPIDGDVYSGLNVYTGDIRKDDELILQHHYYHKPTPWFEEGLYACWTGKKLLKATTYPYTDGKLNLRHLPFDKAPLGFYGISSVEQVMDLQEQLNRAASMIVEARNLMARPRVLASHEAQIPAQSLTDRPGEYIKYKLAGGPPKFEVPNFNFQEMAAHKQDVRNALSQIMGISSASRGEIPAATKTALALQLVLEQDRSQYLPFIKTINQCILDVMTGVLGKAAQFYGDDDPRVIKVEGRSTHRTFHGGMVPNPLDCYLEDTNPLGWTAAGRVEQIGSLIDRGLVTDKNQALDMLQLNSPDPAYETIKINRQAAELEIEELNKGTAMAIGPEDDDHIHLEEHTKVVASFSWRAMSKAAQAAHSDHIKQHKQRVAQAQAAMAAAQAPKPPMGPPAPPMAGGKPPGMHAGPAVAANPNDHDGLHTSLSHASPLQATLAAPGGGDNMEKLLSAKRG